MMPTTMKRECTRCGLQVASRFTALGRSTPLPPIALAATGSSYRYETVVANGERWRTIAAPVTIGGHTVVLRVSRSEERVREELSEVLVVLVLGLPLVVALAGIGGYVLARRALAPIDHLASEARRITAERLHESALTVPNQRDEIGRLAAVINDTFARLESSFDQLRRFTADSSHELRTPLAVVRGIGEAAVAERRSAARVRGSHRQHARGDRPHVEPGRHAVAAVPWRRWLDPPVAGDP